MSRRGTPSPSTGPDDQAVPDGASACAARSDGLGIVTEQSGPAQFFHDHARVALSSGHVFGAGGNGYVRKNIATSMMVLTEAVSRMVAAVERGLSA